MALVDTFASEIYSRPIHRFDDISFTLNKTHFGRFMESSHTAVFVPSPVKGPQCQRKRWPHGQQFVSLLDTGVNQVR